jgi:hypothetical protein
LVLLPVSDTSILEVFKPFHAFIIEALSLRHFPPRQKGRQIG